MTNLRLVEDTNPAENVHSRLIEHILNLTTDVKEADSNAALELLKQAYNLVKENVGVEGEHRFSRIPLRVLNDLHDAAIENHLAHEPVSDLAERLWRHVTVGRARQQLTA